MQQNGVEARIAQNDFEHTARGRIAPEDGVELFANVPRHAPARDLILVCSMLDTVRFIFVAVILGLAGPDAPHPRRNPSPRPGRPRPPPPSSRSTPLAKYLELSGYRISETSPGKLNVKLAVVNHSEADIGDLTLKVKLVTTAAKPEDPPLTEFEAKVPALGPQEIKDVSPPPPPPSCAFTSCRIGSSSALRWRSLLPRLSLNIKT
jgi:hypothetical protein